MVWDDDASGRGGIGEEQDWMSDWLNINMYLNIRENEQQKQQQRGVSRCKCVLNLGLNKK